MERNRKNWNVVIQEHEEAKRLGLVDPDDPTSFRLHIHPIRYSISPQPCHELSITSHQYVQKRESLSSSNGFSESQDEKED